MSRTAAARPGAASVMSSRPSVRPPIASSSTARRRLFIRYPGLAQANEISVLKQSTDLRHAPILASLQLSHARITIVAAEPPGFGEFGGAAIGLAFKGIGGGEVGTGRWTSWIGAACLLKPMDCLAGAGLQKMHDPN